MEPEASLPRSQEPATETYREPVQSSLHPSSYLFKIHFNFILQYGLFSLGFSTTILY
jgi:hypothetical protein